MALMKNPPSFFIIALKAWTPKCQLGESLRTEIEDALKKMNITFKTGKSGKTLEPSAARGLIDSGTRIKLAQKLMKAETKPEAKVREKRVCPHCGKEAGAPLNCPSSCQ